MKLFFLLILLSFCIRIEAGIINNENIHSYDLFENFKKIGLETYTFKKDEFFIIDSKLAIKFKKENHKLLYQISYLKSDFKKLLSLNLKINNKKNIEYDFTDKKKFKKKLYVFEPLLVSSIYPFLKENIRNIDLFIPSENKIIKGKLIYSGIEDKKIKKTIYHLKKYNLTYKNHSFEIFTDKSGLIVFVDWSSIGYQSEITNLRITSFSLNKVSSKRNYKVRIKKLKIKSFPVKIYKYYPKNKNRKLTILIIDGVLFPKMIKDSRDTLSENIFFDKLINKLSKKGYSFLRYSFEDFSIKNNENLTLQKKYEIIKKILNKNKKINTVITLGWGNFLVMKLLNDFSTRFKKIIFLNPIYSSYLTNFKEQTNLEFLTENDRKSLQLSLKHLIKKVYSKDKIIFNDIVVNTSYFKELFKFKIEEYFKYLKSGIKIYIFTANYDSDISSNNGWLLYSKIKNNNIKHKEFLGLNHYFYKIPYKSFAFYYNKSLKIDKEFIKNLNRALRK